MLALCQALRDNYSIAAVTNDIFTREDCEFLIRHAALPAERIKAIETGGCPHAAVREDISTNLAALEDLHREHKTQILLIESGGDNLAANYSRELADFIIYVIDVSGGDKIPRKGGPGITQSDLLVVNKTDLAEIVGADLGVMERDARKMRYVDFYFFYFFFLSFAEDIFALHCALSRYTSMVSGFSTLPRSLSFPIVMKTRLKKKRQGNGPTTLPFEGGRGKGGDACAYP